MSERPYKPPQPPPDCVLDQQAMERLAWHEEMHERGIVDDSTRPEDFSSVMHPSIVNLSLESDSTLPRLKVTR